MDAAVVVLLIAQGIGGLLHAQLCVGLGDGEAVALRDSTEALASSPPDGLAALDVRAYRHPLGMLLGRVSEVVRGRGRPDHRGADLAGASLRGAALAGADLRGALLIGADLRDADLRTADLLGTDLRGADVGGADLREALFLTPPQLTAARGDASTRIPAGFERPGHWAD